ncbi:hypothetical protein AB8B12_33000, partial [Streptomyces sp. PGLac3x]
MRAVLHAHHAPAQRRHGLRQREQIPPPLRPRRLTGRQESPHHGRHLVPPHPARYGHDTDPP